MARLNQKTIAEIKSFKQPMDEIVVVMRAVFLLLGNSKKELLDWKAIKIFIGKTGKEGLKRRIAEHVVVTKPTTNLKALTMARKQVDAIHIDKIQTISHGATVFYGWCHGVLDEMDF